MTARRRAIPAVIVLVLAGVIAACSGVPDSSPPQVISPIAVGRPSNPATNSPAPGDDPGAVVSGFLTANELADDPHHSAARNFLTVDARNNWSDSTVTIVDNVTTPLLVATGRVRFQARVLGKLDNAGVYTPELDGDGTGALTTFTFVVAKQSGQWRIASPYPGVIVDSGSFETQYRSYNLYFFDGSGTQPVADPRYTALSDPEPLTTWLIDELVAGPQSAFSSLSSVPPSLGQRVAASYDENLAQTTIQVPGASQLGAAVRNGIATLLAITLDQVATGQSFRITDSGRPVTVPAAGGTTFTASELARGTVDYPSSRPALYYLRNNAVVDQNGNPVAGPLGRTQPQPLDSIALAQEGRGSLSVAVVTGPPSSAALSIGTLANGVVETRVPTGQLTRPTWAPNADEVWVARGTQIYRVGADGGVTKVALARTSGGPAASITALRISPDGARVAITLTRPDGSGELVIGIIARDASGVRIEDLAPISPAAIKPYDVAWVPLLTGEDRLFLLGQDANGDDNVYDVRVDGSLWSARGTTNLPGAPDSITMAAGSSAWVSTSSTVWVQPSGTAWRNPSGQGSTSTTSGTKPVYVE